MPKRSKPLRELKNLDKWLSLARTRQGLTQKELALKAKISQPRISRIENGDMLPTLSQLIRLAHALQLPLQWFLNGKLKPGVELPDLAFQLHRLGVVDLLIPNAVAPGAFRPTEEVLAIVVREKQPNPRIIEAIPSVLAWNAWNASRLRKESGSRRNQATIRLAWLADIVLTIHRATGFPGGCPQRKQLERFLGRLEKANLRLTNDDLGRPGDANTLPPVSKRWQISYDASLSTFIKRAEHLLKLKGARGS